MDSLTLVCPQKAQAGLTVFYTTPAGVKCATKVPKGVRPGERFTVQFPERREKRTQKKTLNQSHSTKLLEAYEKKKSLSASASCPGLPTAEDRDLIEAYKLRRKNGELGDENYWRAKGFRASGCGEEKKKSVNGFGAPKWSPYYRANIEGEKAVEKRKETLGDQAWWQSYGFKGSMSEHKKRDYGNGVPIWSPYHRSKSIDNTPNNDLNLPCVFLFFSLIFS